MKQPSRTHFGGMWKVLAVIVIFWYTVSSVLASNITSIKNTEPNTITPASSLQKEIETDVALSAKKVWNNLVNFMQDGMDGASTGTEKSQKEKPDSASDIKYPIVRSVLPQTESALLPAFWDISTDPHKASIEALASIWVIQWWASGKYYPHNFVRTSDFIRVVLDIYRYKLGYSLESTNGLSDQSFFKQGYGNTLLLKKLNTAKALWFLDHLGTIELDALITPVQAMQILNTILDLNPYIGQKEKVNLISSSDTQFTKSQMAWYLADIFQLEKSIISPVFNDISNHRYHAAITKLAQLGVVAGKNGNFYPDNDVLRADWIVMLANSLLAQQWKALVITNFTHLPKINDTTYFAAFAPHLEYLLTNEIWDFLLRNEQSGYLFLPHAQLTKWEAYQLVSQATRAKLLNMDQWETSKPITRGELADLIVQAFDFAPKESTPLAYQPTSESQSANTKNQALREEKKWFLATLLKDMMDTL